MKQTKTFLELYPNWAQEAEIAAAGGSRDGSDTASSAETDEEFLIEEPLGHIESTRRWKQKVSYPTTRWGRRDWAACKHEQEHHDRVYVKPRFEENTTGY